jgi:hypothetical protein
MSKSLFILGLLSFILLLGCATPAERARKLYESGEYAQVLTRYPNEPIAQDARIKLAEQVLDSGAYERVIAEYPDTPSAPLAHERIAARLLDEERYDDILADFADTPSALIAREKVAQRMFDDGKLDQLVALYPNSAAGREARNRLCRLDLDALKDLPDDAKIRAAEDILINPSYAGTECHEAAHRMLALLQGLKDRR